MKRMNLVMLALCAGTSVAVAAPRETFDLVALNGAPIPSTDRPGDANNLTMNVAVLGSDGGGSYSATYLTFNGTINAVFGASFLREAVIKITPPTGTAFYAQVLNLGALGTVPTSGTTAVVPVSAFTTAGNWSFEFIDYYDDVADGPDATWSALTVTFEDGPIPAPALGSGPSVTATNLTADGANGNANNGVVAWNNATAGAFNGLRLTGICTMGGSDPATNLNANVTPDLRIQVTAPNGSITQVAPVAGNGLSSQPFDITIGFAGTPVGSWNFRLYDNADIAAATDLYVPSFSAELVTIPPPSPTIPIALVNGSTVSDTQAYTASQVRWYTFTLPADVTAAANRALEIDTETSAATNPSMGLYDGAGNRVATDFDDGSGTQAQLTFGLDGRAAFGTSLVYNGRDGNLLAASGPYYLAVMTSNGTYGPAAWSLTAGAGSAANATVNFRYFDPSSTTPTPTDLGTLVANTTATASTVLAANQIAWFKFTMPVSLSNAENRGLRIDNEGSTTSTANNTSMGLYTSTGAVVLTDTVDGTDSIASMSFGYDSGAAPGNGVAYNGRDGFNIAAGDYYVAVGAGDTGVAFNPAFFASSTSTVTGTVVCNVKLVEPGITPATPPATVTDVGVVGGNVVKTATFTTTAETDVMWAKFTTTAAIAANNTFYLDIDTEDTVMTGTGSNPNDTEIALYNSFGGKMIEDDDDGSGAFSQISIGNAANPRPVIGDSVVPNGRDSATLGAGTFYVAAGSYNKTFANAFTVTHTASTITTGANGTLKVNFRSNLPVPPAQCSLADIGAQGGVAGHDNHLDNNDFVVFIDYFFNHNVAADLGSQGGVHAADGQWDNNDFVVFIDYFFNDAALCTG